MGEYTDRYRHEYPGRPRAATMSDLQRLAQHNPTVKAHLRLWEDGAFISLESMLTALAVCLADANGRLTQNAVMLPDVSWNCPTPNIREDLEQAKRRIEAASIVQQPIVPRKFIDIPPEPVDRSLLDVLAQWYGVAVSQMVRVPFEEAPARRSNWAAEHDHRNEGYPLRVGMPMRRAGQNGGPPHFATLQRGTLDLAACEIYAAKCECGAVFFAHPDTFPTRYENGKLVGGTAFAPADNS